MDRARRNGPVLLESVVGAGPAIYEQAVVKCERAGVVGGLNPTVYSASLHRRAGRRHFSLYEADLTH